MKRATLSRKAAGAVAAVAVSALALAGCSAGGSSDERPLTVWAGVQTPITANFNPFAPTVLAGTVGAIYEPLFLFNRMSTDEPTPLLGDSYEFSEDGRTVTIDIKDGVTWSDGEPFTVEDVVFTYNYEPNVSDPETAPTSVTAIDDDTVEVTYANPQFTRASDVLQITILPEHIWKDVDDFLTFTNETPVGTGPYTVESATSASYILAANEKFREKGVPNVKRVQFIGVDANQSAQDLLTAGKLDWSAMFVPNPDDVTANGIHTMINAPLNPAVVYTCANAELGCTGAQTDVAVRQALNAAIDRGALNEKAFVGLSGTISPAYTLMPRDDKWLADKSLAESPQTADVDEARSILEAAGYVEGADGFYSKDGVPLQMSLTSVDGWTDFNDTTKLIAEQAAAAGIKIDVSTIQWQEYSDSRLTGQYELIMGGIDAAPVADPYQIYSDWFSTVSTAPVGEQLKPGYWNVSRYSNPVVDDAVRAASVTDDEALKLDAYGVIQAEIARDLPYIPIVVNSSETFTNTRDFTGWPTEDDLYAWPPAYGVPSAGYILSKIERK